MLYTTLLFTTLPVLSSAAIQTQTASQECVDSTKFKWFNKQNNYMSCEDFLSTNDPQFNGVLKRNWCSKEVQGEYYLDTTKAFIRDKCPQSCDNCCSDTCLNIEGFNWKYGDNVYSCNWLTASSSNAMNEDRQENWCQQYVVGVGGDFEGQTYKVGAQCPQACNNCCVLSLEL
jgi:hypothetical protein